MRADRELTGVRMKGRAGEIARPLVLDPRARGTDHPNGERASRAETCILRCVEEHRLLGGRDRIPSAGIQGNLHAAVVRAADEAGVGRTGYA